MVKDNPYLEVWRSLSLDQTELNIFEKWSRLDQIWKMILTPLIDIDNLNLSTFWTFVVIDDKGEEIVYKDSEKVTKGERNKDISDRGEFDIGWEIRQRKWIN